MLRRGGAWGSRDGGVQGATAFPLAQEFIDLQYPIGGIASELRFGDRGFSLSAHVRGGSGGDGRGGRGRCSGHVAMI